jgi:hypothetical protein
MLRFCRNRPTVHEVQPRWLSQPGPNAKSRNLGTDSWSERLPKELWMNMARDSASIVLVEILGRSDTPRTGEV